MNTNDKILAALSANPNGIQIGTLAATLEMKLATVSNSITRLRDKGLAFNPPGLRGLYFGTLDEMTAAMPAALMAKAALTQAKKDRRAEECLKRSAAYYRLFVPSPYVKPVKPEVPVVPVRMQMSTKSPLKAGWAKDAPMHVPPGIVIQYGPSPKRGNRTDTYFDTAMSSL